MNWRDRTHEDTPLPNDNWPKSQIDKLGRGGSWILGAKFAEPCF